MGYVKPGFEPVMDKFRSNFESGHDVNSQLCVYVGEDKVVDLWTTASPDHMCIGMSNSKTVSSIQLACLVD
jgi:CubicO group peptidase (beta-lactamase class C family)